jgi:hypothetical protein
MCSADSGSVTVISYSQPCERRLVPEFANAESGFCSPGLGGAGEGLFVIFCSLKSLNFLPIL